MEKNELQHDKAKVKVHDIYTKKGSFQTETGANLNFTNTYIEFTIGDYPLVFKAKVDKGLKEYIEDAYSYA